MLIGPRIGDAFRVCLRERLFCSPINFGDPRGENESRGNRLGEAFNFPSLHSAAAAAFGDGSKRTFSSIAKRRRRRENCQRPF